MKKLSVLAVSALMLGSVAAFEFDLNTVQPGVQLSSAEGGDGGERAQLFPDGKPAKKGPFRLNSPKWPLNGVVEVSADHELIFKPVPGSETGMIVVYTPVPKLQKVRISFSVKGEAFFEKGKGKKYNRMTLTAAGATIFLRGNTLDLRYMDGGLERPKYVALTKMKDGEWQEVTMDVVCSEKSTYSVNDKKDIVQRGKATVVKSLVFSAYFDQIKPETCIKIKDLKITEIQ